MSERTFVYIPSFSSGTSSWASKKNPRLKDGMPWRFWDPEYPSQYRHPAFLISAGHSYKDMEYAKKFEFTPDTLIFGDSGGFQISTGVIKWDVSIRQKIFDWLEANSNISMNLDIPTRGEYEGRFHEAMDISIDNFKFFADRQSGKTDFLNVLQGSTYDKYKSWYKKVHEFPFQGWAIGGAPGSMVGFMSAICVMAEGKELTNPNFKWMHFLGMSSVIEFLMLAQFQKSLNDIGSTITATTDSSTPSRCVSYGYYYMGYDFKNLNFNYTHIPRKDHFDFSGVKTKSMPIMNDMDRRIWDSYTLEEFVEWKSEHYSWLVTHNFSIFQDCIRIANNLVYNDEYILSQNVTKDTLIILKSIDSMVKSSEPKKILDKFMPLYIELSRRLFNNNSQAQDNPFF